MSSKHKWYYKERILSKKYINSKTSIFLWIYLLECSKCGHKAELESYKRYFEEALLYPESIIEYV